MIRRYTREAGVRNLERELSTLARKAVKELMLSKKKSVKITEKTLEEFLGVPKYRFGEIETDDQVGVVTGLAWTDVGGELLTIGRDDAGQGPHDGHRQPARCDEGVDLGRGVLCPQPCCHLRHRAAAVRPAGHPRARAGRRDAEGRSVGGRGDGDRHHIGADRHSGPSRHRHDRRDHAARTGAADRRVEGEVARRRARRHQDGADPEDNAKDLTEISDAIKGGLEIIPVSRMDEVIARALVRKPVPIEWEEDKAVPPKAEAGDDAGLTAH